MFSTLAFESARTLAALDKTYLIFDLAPDGRIVAVNANACRALGYAREELQGRPHNMLLRPGQADHERDILERLARGENGV